MRLQTLLSRSGPGEHSWTGYQAFSGRFYTSATAQKLWLETSAFLMTRVNNYTGVAYNRDPTVMAWQVRRIPLLPQLSPPCPCRIITPEPTLADVMMLQTTAARGAASFSALGERAGIV